MPGPAPVVIPRSADERIDDLLALAAGDGRPVAIGWATVELDRAASELGRVLGIPADRFVPAPDSIALGARCRIGHDVLPGAVSLAILEPSTEGRLAYVLARSGEGPAVVWSSPDAPAGSAIGAARPGPFGLERAVPGSPIGGPERFLVETAPGTIPP